MDNEKTIKDVREKGSLGKVQVNSLFLYAFFSFAILAISNYSTFFSKAPLSWDECGYLGQAALLAGIKWTGVVHQLPYYSFGNGLFVLGLFKLVSDPILLYRMILIVNSLILVISFLLCDSILKELFCSLPRFTRISISFLTICYPSNIAYSDYFLAETYITFAFWLVSYLILMYVKKKKIIFLIFGVISLCWLFTIHNRVIGIFVTGIIVCSFFALRSSSNRIIKTLIILCLALLLIIIAIHYKSYSKEALWPVISSKDRDLNDYNSYVKNEQLYFYTEGAVYILKNLLAKLWYHFIATMGFAFWGIIKCIKSLKEKIKTRDYDMAGWYSFILLSSFFSFAIIVLSMSIPARVDHIIMGRYMDALIGPFLAIGLSELFNENIFFSNKRIYSSICISLLGGKLIESYILETKQYTSLKMEISSNAAINSFLTNPYKSGTMIMVGIFFSLAFFGCFLARKKKGILLFVILCFYLFENISWANNHIINYQKKINEPLFEVTKNIKRNDEETTVGYLPTNQLANQLQWLLPKTKIVPINELEDYDKDKYDYIFLNDESYISKYMMDDYEVIDTEKYILLERRE